MSTTGLTAYSESPSPEVISLAEAKRHLRVDHDDDDDVIQACIDGAVDGAENETNAGFYPRSYILTLPCFPSCPSEIPLPIHPLIEVTGVTYLDSDGAEQTLDAAFYDVASNCLPPKLALASGKSWPTTKRHPEAVRVAFRAGFAVCPAGALVGIKLLLGHLYENREATAAGAVVTEIPLGARHWLAPYRLWATM